MAATDTAVTDTPSIALPGLGRALVMAGKLGQKSAEEIYRKAQAPHTVHRRTHRFWCGFGRRPGTHDVHRVCGAAAGPGGH
jgi:hypothetical protein